MLCSMHARALPASPASPQRGRAPQPADPCPSLMASFTGDNGSGGASEGPTQPLAQSCLDSYVIERHSSDGDIFCFRAAG